MLRTLLLLLIPGFFALHAYAQTSVPPLALALYEPVPRVVAPGEGHEAPSDAIVLFDGSNTDAWQHPDGRPAEWTLSEKAMTVKPGTGWIKSKQRFGSMQMHLEFRSPSKIISEGQGRGNSGLFIMDRYEIQILDSYENATYVNGQASAIYKQHIPLVNAMRPPGEWNSYDVFFQAPVFNEDKILVTPAYVTVLLNGVLVQNHVQIKGPTKDTQVPFYQYHEPKMPIGLQDHSNEVSFRNIWVREL